MTLHYISMNLYDCNCPIEQLKNYISFYKALILMYACTINIDGLEYSFLFFNFLLYFIIKLCGQRSITMEEILSNRLLMTHVFYNY